MSAPHNWLKAAIEDATGSQGVTAWPVEMTGTGEPPYAIYTRTGTSRELVLTDTLDESPSADECPPLATFSVVVYADSYVEAWEIADAIASAIHKFAGTAHGETIQEASVIEERDGDAGFLEGREQPTYTVELTIQIRWH
jgi:hypothetical protein